MATKILHSSQSLEALPCAAVIQYIKVLYIFVPPMYRQHVVEGFLSSPLKLKRLVNLTYSRFVSMFHASYTDFMKMRTQIGRKGKLKSNTALEMLQQRPTSFSYRNN